MAKQKVIDNQFDFEEVEIIDEKDIEIVVKQELGTITTNFELVKEGIKNKTAPFKDIAVTEQNKTKIKKVIASFRSDIKIINSKRISVKEDCLKPYVEYDGLSKKLIDIYNKAIDDMDNQVKELEEAQRLLKKSEIEEFYISIIGDLKKDLSLDMIYDDKWENASVNIKSVKEDMTARIEKVKQEIGIIKSMVSDKMDDALDSYLLDFNLSNSMSIMTKYEEDKKRIVAQQEEKQRLAREQELEQEKARIKREAYAEIEREKKIKEDAENKAQAEKEAELEVLREEERIKAQEEQEAINKAEREAMAVCKQENQSFMETNIYSITATPGETIQIEMYLESLAIDWERMC